MKPPLPVLLAGPPGRRRDSLQLLLQTMSGVGQIELVDELPDLLAAVANGRSYLLIVDAAFAPERIWQLPAWLKTTDSPARLLLIVTTLAEKGRARHSGVPAVLLRGFSSAELRQAVLTLTG